jgi:hypothetical protein
VKGPVSIPMLSSLKGRPESSICEIIKQLGGRGSTPNASGRGQVKVIGATTYRARSLMSTRTQVHKNSVYGVLRKFRDPASQGSSDCHARVGATVSTLQHCGSLN